MKKTGASRGKHGGRRRRGARDASGETGIVAPERFRKARWWDERAAKLSARGAALEACLAARRAVEHYPEAPCIHCNLAVMLSHAGLEEDATVAAQAAAARAIDGWSSLEADDARMLSVVAVILARTDLEVALRFTRRSHELDPSDALVAENRADVLMRGGFHADALPVLRRLERTAPDDEDTHVLLLSCYYAIGMADEAMATGEEILRRWPGAADSQFNLALVYLDHGREEDAISMLQDAVRSGPDVAVARGLLGVAYATCGRDGDARGEQAEARRLGGGRPEVDRLIDEIDDLLGDDHHRDKTRLLLQLMLTCWLARAKSRNGASR